MSTQEEQALARRITKCGTPPAYPDSRTDAEKVAAREDRDRIVARHRKSPTGFQASCNLPTTRYAKRLSDIPEDATPPKGVGFEWDDKRQVFAYLVPCGFGATTDREAFERHMKEAHGRTPATWLRREHGGADAWQTEDLTKPHRPVLNQKTDEVDLSRVPKASRERLKRCSACGEVYEASVPGFVEVEVDHKLTCRGWSE